MFLIRVRNDVWWIFKRRVKNSLIHLISGIHFVEKFLIWGVSADFSKNVPFLGHYLSSKYFSFLSLNFSRQGTSFKHPYDYFWVMILWLKMWENWSKPKNLVTIVWITHFFLKVHILIFYLMHIKKTFFVFIEFF